MADELSRLKQYDYAANANLVLAQTERRRRDPSEPTGEVEPLKVSELKGRMGDRVSHERAPELEERLQRLQKSKSMQNRGIFADKKRRKEARNLTGDYGDVIAAARDLELGVYRPTTSETRVAYEYLLDFITKRIGDQPQDVLHGAANEVLAILKEQKTTEEQKIEDVKELIGEMDADSFAELSNISRSITDYGKEEDQFQTEEETAAGQTMDEDLGVAVVFEDEENETESNLDELVVLDDDDYENEGEGDEANIDSTLESTNVPSEIDTKDNAESRYYVHVREIDGYWLQRSLVKHYSDVDKSRQVAEQVFRILSDESMNIRECENQLVLLLGFDKFELVKKLLINRWKIVYCTKLALSSSEDERKILQGKMKDDPQLSGILEELVSEDNVMQEDKRMLDTKATMKHDRERSALNSDSNILPVVDLESLALQGGSHFMSIAKVELPKGSVRVQKKDYEEVYVPAPKSKPVSGDEKLVPIEQLPEWAREAFKGMRSLNRIQSQLYKAAFESDENLLLCAPTGSGKTNVAVLSILRLISQALEEGDESLESFKAVYVAPMKALVAEVVGNLDRRLSYLGLTVHELTGDVSMTWKEIMETSVIVTTPEKWDIVTRKTGERAVVDYVKLLIIDEIHLLHDERGPVLESIVARTIRSMETSNWNCRLVGLSATLPNYHDVSVFMKVDPNVGLFYFDNSYRPVPLQQEFVGVTVKSALKRYQAMNEIAYQKVKQEIMGGASQHQQILVFVHSRKETAKTASYFRDMAVQENIFDSFLTPGSASAEIIKSELENVKNQQLAGLLTHGFAIHHAGLTRSDRTLVEDLFADGHIRCLVSTATLAWGVNLPAHTVIIKGTQVYSPEKAKWTELSAMDVMQMMGRAGRPQYDTSGKGIIITSANELQYYLSLLNTQLPIESQMIARLADFMNAEIALGTVHDLEDCADWLSYTYLFVRMLKNPVLYGITPELVKQDPTLKQRRLQLVHSAAVTLDNAGLIRYEKRSGSIQPTDLGRVAARYYVTYHTATIYSENISLNLTEVDICRLITLSSEFCFMRVREEEKLELERLAERTPIPIKESLDEPTAKANVLLQSYISKLKLEGLALAADAVFISQSAGRLARALFEISLRRRYAQVSLRCLNLAKAIDRRIWPHSHTPLRQFSSHLPEEVLKRIERKTDLEIEQYLDLSPAELGELFRSPKDGKTIHRLLHLLPRMELAVHVQPITRSTIRMELTLTPDFLFDSKVHGAGEPFWIWVEDPDGENLLHVEPFYLRASLSQEEHTVAFIVPVLDPLPPQYFIRCISDRWISPEVTLPVSFKHLILPSKFSPFTDLLDMQPLSVYSAFRSPLEKETEAMWYVLSGLEAHFSKSFEHFNPIQTQTFAAIFKTNENIFVASPPGSGRLVLIELALGRLFALDPAATAVYVVAKEDLAQRRLEELSLGLAQVLGFSVHYMTGESTIDLGYLAVPGSVLIATPERWDALSRRWKHRKAVRQVSLFIIDDLHLVSCGIGGGIGNRNAVNGVAMEISCSRMRLMSHQVSAAGGKPCRMIGLSDPIANARDLGDWLFVPSQYIFTFHHSARPIPLVTHIQSNEFGGTGFGFGLDAFSGSVSAAAAAMVRPISSLLRKYWNNTASSVIIFVPSRRLTRALATELIYNLSTQQLDFLSLSQQDIEPLKQEVKSSSLKECMSMGILFCHESMDNYDQKLVEKLFGTGACRLLITTEAFTWTSSVCAQTVIIAGTSFGGAGGSSSVGGYSDALRRSDYAVADIMRMMGRAGRPLEDVSGTCVILTDPSSKEYYQKFLKDPLPVESHLDMILADLLNAEVASHIVETKQDAVDLITWTLYYRRLAQNPNYYGITGATPKHISDHLSECIDNALNELENCKCVALEGFEEKQDEEMTDEMPSRKEDADTAIGPLNLGMIAAFYYIRYTTVELFASSISEKIRLRGLLEVLSSASEYYTVPIRVGEDEVLRKIASHAPYAPIGSSGGVSHFSRIPLKGELAEDREVVIAGAPRLIQALVDVISSAGYLKAALAAMETCQMIIQGMWERDSLLLQLPHMDKERCDQLKEMGVESVFDFMEMEDEQRRQSLQGLSRQQIADIVDACAAYPNVDLSFQLICEESSSSEVVYPGSTIRLVAQLTREEEEETTEEVADHPIAYSTRFPEKKEESWWLLVGELGSSQTLVAIKRLVIKGGGKSNQVKS
ncbi:Putative U5 small nuclear ribonucleoprotein 200 kDa helicase [Galdieria sulphuraria]|nr:Putative U5 small nuclear ribonucleoprotein 200 kDa helicase [Galdieria sulphuraria]